MRPGSAIASNDLVGETHWPDPTTGASSSSQKDVVTVNALGQTASSTDRDGTTHTLSYDILGRVISDAVTTLGAGVDGAVRRIETAYDGQGNPYLVTNYDAATGGNIVNQVKQDYNGLGQLTNDWQEHAGAVTGSSVRVQYAYTEMSGGANNSRQTSMIYPNGRVVNDNYTSGLDDTISRLSSLSDSSATLEAYSYLGLGTIVQRSHPQPGVDLTYIKQSGEANGDAGDQYTGLDRFGRVVDQRWIVASTGVATDRFQYGYDRDSNRTYRDNLVNAAFGEVYTNDGLNQLSSFQRGTLNGTKDGITGTASRSQSWNYDAAGNFDSVTSDGTSQTRTANAQNEVTSVSGATTPTFDAAGNMTGDETGKQFVYDAWNRLVAVKSASGTTLETLAYDGLNRRVAQTVSGTTTDLYYSSAWQVLEERAGGVATTQYVWSPAYVDALIERDRDTNGDGTLDERLYAQQDANYNTTALVSSSGNVVERYGYDAFGAATIYSPTYSVLSASGYASTVLFQGMMWDATSGTYRSRGRSGYSPTLGRWVTTDPLMFAAGDNSLYRMEGNNPVDRLDPQGTQLIIPIPVPQKCPPIPYGTLTTISGALWWLIEGAGRDTIPMPLPTLPKPNITIRLEPLSPPVPWVDPTRIPPDLLNPPMPGRGYAPAIPKVMRKYDGPSNMAKGKQDLRNHITDLILRKYGHLTRSEVCELLEQWRQAAKQIGDSKEMAAIKIAQKYFGCRPTHYGK